MCGIAGIYSRPGQLASPELLLAMAGELHHRGPDGVGLYLDGRFGMSNTRLAIVDLAGGDQPLSNEGGRFWVMQNGEIYNYVELQEELRSLGHRFETSSDTEVIAHAYDEWGVDCLARLNGDFAFAVWDRREQELFLARDRFGVRPLFLAEIGGDLCFASEAKALFRHPSSRRELDPLGLVEAFTTWSILPDRSAFVGVRELAPAHYLRFGPNGLIEEKRWWDLQFPRVDDEESKSEPELAEELLELLTDATRIRLRADVPVAAYLSGGLDSSLTAALARSLYPGHAELVRDRLQRPALRREPLPGPLRRGSRHEPDARRRRLLRHRRAPPARGRAVREADTAHGSRAAPAAVRRRAATQDSRWSSPVRAPTSCSAATTSTARTRSGGSGPGSPNPSSGRSSSRA